MSKTIALLSALVSSTVALVAMQHGGSPEVTSRTVDYSVDDTEMRATVAVPADVEEAPVVLIVPDWMGPRPYFDEMAEKIAGWGYVALVADVYGVDVRPESMKEASQASGNLKKNPEVLRTRIQKALEVARDLDKANTDKVAAIGFCFGGTTVIELARTGADVDAIVSFHGGLEVLEPKADGDFQASVLALHGYQDPYVPQELVSAFKEELAEADVDWVFVSFGNTVHSFTDPEADMAGKAEYNEQSADRAWRMAKNFLEEKLKE